MEKYKSKQDISLGKPLLDDYETYVGILTNSPEAQRLYLRKYERIRKRHLNETKISRKTNSWEGV